MSASNAYRAPADPPPHQRWAGRERRSPDPVNQLGRSLDGICREASDAFEIAAHLEALGYDRERAGRDYGAVDTFALARQLYQRVPRRRPPPRERTRAGADPLRWLLMVGALLFTAGVGAVAHGYAWPAVLWLLVWSQIGAVLLQRGRDALPERELGGLLPLTALLGVAGLALSYPITPFGPPTALISLTWLGVALSLWSGRTGRGLVVLLLTVLAGAAAAFAHAWFGWAALPAALLPVALLPPLRRRMALRVLLPWSARQLRALALPAAYGIGQGLVLLHLVQASEDAHALAGLALFAGILLVSEPALAALLRRLRRALWRGDSTRGYAADARRAVGLYAAGYLAVPLVLAGAWLAGLGGRWVPELLLFSLFGVALALALVALALGQPGRPALLFLAAGLLVVVGAPVAPLLAALVVAVLVALLALTGEVPRYAVHLL